MLAPRASSAFVCLRCELTLARPRLPVLPRRAPHASLSSSSRRRDAFDDEFQRTTPRPQLSERPLSHVRKRRGGRAIRETTARLEGAKTLGEDAAILVLEEVGEGSKKPKREPEIVRDDDGEVPLRLAEALANEKPATLEEVVTQLDKVRQKAANTKFTLDEEHYVSQSVFTKLSAHLLRAFTGPQLSHYYSVRKGVGKDRVADQVLEGVKQLQGKSKRPAERSEWTPGTTQMDRRLPSLDVHSRKKRKAIGKHLLVDQILRDVWKLVMLEEIEAAGELELALNDWQLILLTSGANETPLDRIGRARMAKLEIHYGHKVLRITADKHTAEYAADDVESLLQTSESTRFHFAPWIPNLEISATGNPSISDVFPNEILRTVATLTGAYLQRTTDKIIIRALDKDTVAETERCLIKLMPLKNPGLDSVDTTGRDVLKSSDHFLPIMFEKEAVGYKVRDTQLGRWSFPMNQDNVPLPGSESVAERVKAAQEYVPKMVSTPLSQYQRSTPDPLKVSLRKWAHHPETRLKAQFGHALYPLGDPTSERPHFVSALPGLSSIFNSEAYQTRFATRPSLRYEYIAQPGPANYTSSLLPYQYPKISIYFRPNHSGQYEMQKVVLQFGQATHQVLLPEEAVDIQFLTTQSLLMSAPKTIKYMQEYEDQVVQNLESGGRLNAPDIVLDIPRWTVGGMDFDKKDDMTRANFLFTGITFLQSVWGQYHGSTVTYSTQQSGKLGVKDGTFTLVYGMTGEAKKMAITDSPNAMREFVADAFKMAGKITQAAAASQSGMKKIERKPKTKESSQTLPRSDDATTLETANEDLSNDRSNENEIEASHDTESPEEVNEDPYILSNLDDTASSSSHNEEPLSTRTEEPSEEEQKRRLESAT